MQEFNQFLKKELNKPQYQAVTHKKGSVIVIAGAGSGKTRIITARIANLILNQKAEPSSIVALTFTNKAAGEMKERLIKFLGTDHKLPFVGTFHSYCLLLLRTNPSLLAYPEFSILDSEDQTSLIKKIIKKNGMEKQLSASEVNHRISKIKNQLNFNFEDDYMGQQIFKEMYMAYEQEKSMAHCFDFDDLILEVLKLFKTNKSFKSKFQEKTKHLLVDEYQDTNHVQHELLKNMSLDGKNKFILESICAVGDEDQSIYSWRGAVATNMLQFQKDFAPVQIIKIEQNYRSVCPILDAANKVIVNNPDRTNKNLWSKKKAKNRILVLQCRSGQQEAQTIANIISSLSSEKKLNEIAIFYRTHYQSRSIEESLIYNSIPYKIIGGIRFYERKEIKDLLAYLRLLVNPFDRTSFFRVINCPPRGLGTKFEEIIFEEWNKNTLLNFKQLLDLCLKKKQKKLTPSKIESIQKFLNIFREFDAQQKPSQILKQIIEETDYLNFINKTFDPREAETKTENVKEFIRSAHNFERKSSQNTIDIFLQEISLMQEKMDTKQEIDQQVQCMTLHSAKGLEFDTAIIAGLEEGLLPSNRSLSVAKSLEEERRLFYVGMTRAKERLILLHANYRNSFGQISDQVSSRFVDEVPKRLTQKIDISEMGIIQIKSLLNKWLGKKETSKNILTFQDFAKKTSLPNFIQQSAPTKNQSPWKKNQFVMHKKFGVGIIKKVEKKDETQYYITTQFKCGEKKVLSNFLSHCQS